MGEHNLVTADYLEEVDDHDGDNGIDVNDNDIDDGDNDIDGDDDDSEHQMIVHQL